MAIFIKVQDDRVLSYGKNGDIEVADWPTDPATGDPARKQDVYWTGSEVLLKTTSMNVSDYREQQVNSVRDHYRNWWMTFSPSKTWDQIRDAYWDFITSVESATTEAQIDTARNQLYSKLYPE